MIVNTTSNHFHNHSHKHHHFHTPRHRRAGHCAAAHLQAMAKVVGFSVRCGIVVYVGGRCHCRCHNGHQIAVVIVIVVTVIVIVICVVTVVVFIVVLVLVVIFAAFIVVVIVLGISIFEVIGDGLSIRFPYPAAVIEESSRSQGIQSLHWSIGRGMASIEERMDCFDWIDQLAMSMAGTFPIGGCRGGQSCCWRHIEGWMLSQTFRCLPRRHRQRRPPSNERKRIEKVEFVFTRKTA